MNRRPRPPRASRRACLLAVPVAAGVAASVLGRAGAPAPRLAAASASRPPASYGTLLPGHHVDLSHLPPDLGPHPALHRPEHDGKRGRAPRSGEEAAAAGGGRAATLAAARTGGGAPVAQPPLRLAATVTSTAVNLITSFSATTYALDTQAFSDQWLDPPDTQLAVGASTVVEAVNDTLALWPEAGGTAPTALVDLNRFFSVPSGYMFTDPRVLYDQLSGRFILSGLMFDSANDSQVVLAVSDSGSPSITASPAGGWTVYGVTAVTAGVVHDQPILGVSSDKIALSWNDFGPVAGKLSPTGESTLIVDKGDALAGAAAPRSATFSDPTRAGLVPVHSLTATTTQYVVVNLPGGTSGHLGVIAVTGTPSQANVVATETDLPSRSTSPPPNAPQLGTADLLDTGWDRLLSGVWRNGVLWTAGNDTCTPSGDTAARACVHLLEVSTAAAAPSMVLDAEAGVAGSYIFYPAVAIDSGGNLDMVASRSSPSQYASLVAYGMLASAGAGALQGPVTIAAGAGPHLRLSSSDDSARFGDYSGAAVDPAAPQNVWVAGEVQASATNGHAWGTWIGEVSFQDPVARFVSQAYLDLLGRPADTAGLGFWTTAIETGTPRSAIATAFTASTEYRQAQVDALYLHYLGHLPDSAGLQAWVNVIGSGGTYEQLIAALTGSDEYFYGKSGGVIDTFVRNVYLDVLARPADQAGETYWDGQLAAPGVARSSITNDFSHSPEYYTLLVTRDYNALLRRAPDSSGLSYWVSAFEQGVRDEVMVSNFVGSAEYYTYAQTH